MKTAHDPRHQRRREVVRKIYAVGFGFEQSQGDVIETPDVTEMVKQLTARQEEIDATIEKSAPAWPVEKLNRIDRSILELAVFELLEGKEPEKVIIDEAVELAKEFGSENSGSFVNGVLGNIVSLKNGEDTKN